MAVGGGILAVIGGTGDGAKTEPERGQLEMRELRNFRASSIRELPQVPSATPQAEATLSEPASDVPPADPPPVVDATAPVTPVEAAICAYPWNCHTAIRIFRCESNLRPGAIGAGSYGLTQIQASVHAWKWPTFWEDWMIPERNLAYAWEIYQGRGWAAWSCA